MIPSESITFVATLQQVPDPRQRRGIRYPWNTLLLLISAAMLSGQQSVAAIAQWVQEHAETIRTQLDLPRLGLPSGATVMRALQKIDVAALEARLQQFVARLAPLVARGAEPWPALAIDGKAVRGANRHGAKVHLVSWVTHQAGTVLGQVQVADKTNEIPAVRQLLRAHSLTGQVITADAMHTQRATAQQILEQGGQYFLVVKANQPELFAALRDWFASPAWPEEDEQTWTTTQKAHGRLERRTLTRRLTRATPVGWLGEQQVMRRCCWVKHLSTGKISQEVTYAITSLPPSLASARQLETYWRGHWTIENKVHYVRDVTMGEDACQVRGGHAPHAMAALRNALLNILRSLGSSNIAQSLRHFAACAGDALRLLLDPLLVT